MKLLNTTVRNVLILGVILALAAAMFWLVSGQMQAPQTAQAGPTATNTPIATATLQPTNTPSISPTATLWPTSNAVPVATDPYPIFQVTPIPGATYTPASAGVEAAVAPSSIKVVDHQLLPLNQLFPLSSMSDEGVSANALFEAIGWTEQGEILFQEQSLIERDGTYFPGSLYQVAGTWAIAPTDGEVTALTSWMPSTVVVEGFMDSVVKGPMWVIHGYNNMGISAIDWATIPTWTPTQRQLASEWAIKKPINFPQYWYASSDGETVILRIVTDKIYILKPNKTEPAVILPKGDNRYESAAKAQISPDGQKIVYGVRTDNPENNDGYGNETDAYEIQISSLDGENIVTIKPAYEFGFPDKFTWSPDSKFIAFIAQSEDHSPTHLYIAKADGSAVTDITPVDFWADGPLQWSLDGQKIVYTGGNPNTPESVGYWVTSLTK